MQTTQITSCFLKKIEINKFPAIKVSLNVGVNRPWDSGKHLDTILIVNDAK